MEYSTSYGPAEGRFAVQQPHRSAPLGLVFFEQAVHDEPLRPKKQDGAPSLAGRSIPAERGLHDLDSPAVRVDSATQRRGRARERLVGLEQRILDRHDRRPAGDPAPALVGDVVAEDAVAVPPVPPAPELPPVPPIPAEPSVPPVVPLPPSSLSLPHPTVTTAHNKIAARPKTLIALSFRNDPIGSTNSRMVCQRASSR